MVTHLTDEELQEQKLDICEKYRRDLEFLKNGRTRIEDTLSHSGIDDATISKKLEKLNKSINTIENLIEEFENRRLETPDDDRFIYLTDEEADDDAESTD